MQAERRAAWNPGNRLGVVCVNGGRAAPVEGTWNASLEWLVRRLAPRFPRLSFLEVRYRVKSWRELERCAEDARAAVAALDPELCLLVGFSMGAAVAVSVAEIASVAGVLGLAAWLPDELDVADLKDKRLDIVHGSLDRSLPGYPGVDPAHSRRAYDRAPGGARAATTG